jgi:hypothetical protein
MLDQFVHVSLQTLFFVVSSATMATTVERRVAAPDAGFALRPTCGIHPIGEPITVSADPECLGGLKRCTAVNTVP